MYTHPSRKNQHREFLLSAYRRLMSDRCEETYQQAGKFNWCGQICLPVYTEDPDHAANFPAEPRRNAHQPLGIVCSRVRRASTAERSLELH